MILSTQYAAGPRNSAFPRLSRPIAFGAAAVAAAAVALTGCSKASTGAAASSGALNQIKLAADTSRDVNSLTANITVHSVGTTAGGLTGTIRMQLKPTTLIEARFDVPATTSPGIHLDEILTGQAIYFKNPAFTKTKAGKPWVKAKISELSSKSGLSFGSLLQNLESSNPLDQTRLFTASRDVRVVGTRTVGGLRRAFRASARGARADAAVDRHASGQLPRLGRRAAPDQEGRRHGERARPDRHHHLRGDLGQPAGEGHAAEGRRNRAAAEALSQPAPARP